MDRHRLVVVKRDLIDVELLVLHLEHDAQDDLEQVVVLRLKHLVHRKVVVLQPRHHGKIFRVRRARRDDLSVAVEVQVKSRVVYTCDRRFLVRRDVDLALIVHLDGDLLDERQRLRLVILVIPFDQQRVPVAEPVADHVVADFLLRVSLGKSDDRHGDVLYRVDQVLRVQLKCNDNEK